MRVVWVLRVEWGSVTWLFWGFGEEGGEGALGWLLAIAEVVVNVVFAVLSFVVVKDVRFTVVVTGTAVVPECRLYRSPSCALCCYSTDRKRGGRG